MRLDAEWLQTTRYHLDVLRAMTDMDGCREYREAVLAFAGGELDEPDGIKLMKLAREAQDAANRLMAFSATITGGADGELTKAGRVHGKPGRHEFKSPYAKMGGGSLHRRVVG